MAAICMCVPTALQNSCHKTDRGASTTNCHVRVHIVQTTPTTTTTTKMSTSAPRCCVCSLEHFYRWRHINFCSRSVLWDSVGCVPGVHKCVCVCVLCAFAPRFAINNCTIINRLHEHRGNDELPLPAAFKKHSTELAAVADDAMPKAK